MRTWARPGWWQDSVGGGEARRTVEARAYVGAPPRPGPTARVSLRVAKVSHQPRVEAAHGGRVRVLIERIEPGGDTSQIQLFQVMVQGGDEEDLLLAVTANRANPEAASSTVIRRSAAERRRARERSPRSRCSRRRRRGVPGLLHPVRGSHRLRSSIVPSVPRGAGFRSTPRRRLVRGRAHGPDAARGLREATQERWSTRSARSVHPANSRDRPRNTPGGRTRS